MPWWYGYALPGIWFFCWCWLRRLWCFWQTRQQKSLRKLEWYKTALWLGALIFCTAVQVYYHIDMRQQANQMVVAINQFQQQHQRYPHDRAELGDIDGLENRRIYYFQHKNRPIVSYPATFIVYDTYRYDFEQHQWRYQPE